jgi:putative ABC transport system ATP-binding protein
MNRKVLEIKNVMKRVAHEKKILNNVSFALNEGEFVVIHGKSGAGKTTLLKIIGCLDIDFEGEIAFNGKVMKKEEDFDISRQNIGFVFQDFQLFDYLTVFENIAIAQVMKGHQLNEAKINEILTFLNIRDKANEHVYLLSGGEKQRVSIARAIVPNPHILIADEPTGALDVENSAYVLECLKKLNEQGTTIILVTHDLDIIQNYGTKKVLISQGEINEI